MKIEKLKYQKADFAKTPIASSEDVYLIAEKIDEIIDHLNTPPATEGKECEHELVYGTKHAGCRKCGIEKEAKHALANDLTDTNKKCNHSWTFANNMVPQCCFCGENMDSTAEKKEEPKEVEFEAKDDDRGWHWVESESITDYKKNKKLQLLLTELMKLDSNQWELIDEALSDIGYKRSAEVAPIAQRILKARKDYEGGGK